MIDPVSRPTAERQASLARWLDLTRRILPRMAAEHHWPIRLDHCFMRVCLDEALGARWDSIVSRPAIRHLTDAQLARAVAIAELIAEQPHRLPSLNRSSLRARGRGDASGPQRI